MADDRASRLKRISLGAKVAGAFEKAKDEDDLHSGRISDRTGDSTGRSFLSKNSRGLYMMPDGYESPEEQEEMISVQQAGSNLHSAPPPSKNAAYIGDGRYVDTGLGAAPMGEDPIIKTAGKNSQLYWEAPDPLGVDRRPEFSKKPAMKFPESTSAEPRVPRPSFLDEVPPWKGPGSWAAYPGIGGGFPGGGQPSAPVGGRGTQPGFGFSGNPGIGRPAGFGYGAAPYRAPDYHMYDDDSQAFGTLWNLNPRNVNEFASQMDQMFRCLGTGVDKTNDKLNTKINRTDLKFDELESDSRAAYHDNALHGISPAYFRPIRNEIPVSRIPPRSAHRHNVFAR